jgi:hypothetical protein
VEVFSRNKSDKVIGLMANTFKGLSELADWEAPAAPVHPEGAVPKTPTTEANNELPTGEIRPERGSNKPLQLHYNIQVHLPESRDPAVFEAIFHALRKHLT